MVIQHNILAMYAYRQLGYHQTALARSLQRLSSGYRINSAADDPAGLGISERMRAQITGLTQATRNAQDGLSLVNVAEGALTEVHSMLNRLVDISTHAANGTMQGDDRQRLQQEADQILEEINRIAGATKFGSIPLLDGNVQEGKITLQVGDTNNAYDKINIYLPNLRQIADGLNGFDVSTQESAAAALDKVKSVISDVSTARGNLGAMSNRLGYTINSLNVTVQNLTDAESRIRDADMAKEMMTFAREQALSQVALMMMSHTMQQPYQILQLLHGI